VVVLTGSKQRITVGQVVAKFGWTKIGICQQRFIHQQLSRRCDVVGLNRHSEPVAEFLR
jgi:hypothetical protein